MFYSLQSVTFDTKASSPHRSKGTYQADWPIGPRRKPPVFPEDDVERWVLASYLPFTVAFPETIPTDNHAGTFPDSTRSSPRTLRWGRHPPLPC